ncbi:ABC transporter substrate-binding protein [Cohnella zeiphila]|uniref:Probable sugar-binding periplasmic protein n=1 Tax=Cohnella zeiphila TaxID=2761120 RepID=A0A7X0VU67_9BACL|nr:ABC transporter substrate-binding protein [Cohnella zeiphila]MBB6729952.1 carbohydrate ABC transporter substrate-binding protein [Cohnella zeiphila]
MRKKLIKWAAGASSMALIVSVFTACSGVNDPDAATDGTASAAASASSDVNGKQTLAVSTLTEDRFLKDAVDRFEKAHPDIDVQIRESVPMDTSDGKGTSKMRAGEEGPPAADRDKYVNSVGTALLSGNAADLISISYLPVDKYLATGMFADWSPIVSQDTDFNMGDYYVHVLQGITDADKGWYAIPIDYTLNVLIGNKPAIDQAGGVDDKTWTWEQFIALCQKIASTPNADGTTPQALGGFKPEDVLVYLTTTVYDRLVTKQGSISSFDEAAFKGYLEQVKQLYDSGAASSNLGNTSQVFSPMTMQMIQDLAILPKVVGGGDGEVLSPPGSGQDEGLPFDSDLAFALNDRSKVKPAAWEFIKFLLSEEIQSSASMMAFPVNQVAAKTRMDDFSKELQSGGDKMMFQPANGPAQSLSITDDQMNTALALLPSVGKYERKDDKVIGMIKEETASYFSGGKSSDAVAKAVANRVRTYLNE